MSKFKAQGFRNTFKNARKGMRLAVRSERNIRVHLICAIFVLLLGMLLELSVTKFCILLLTIAMVVSMEMINSAIEFSLDAVFHNRREEFCINRMDKFRSHLIKQVKSSRFLHFQNLIKMRYYSQRA